MGRGLRIKKLRHQPRNKTQLLRITKRPHFHIIRLRQNTLQLVAGMNGEMNHGEAR